VEERFASYTLLRCRLETGRTHQIRVHMQSMGHSLVGDPVYGGRSKASGSLAAAIKAFGRQALHATRLGLLHPVSGEAMSWQADLPADMQQLLDVLRDEQA
jgi:23S rRNA pseudouridine1911/1915/1917 synthase